MSGGDLNRWIASELLRARGTLREVIRSSPLTQSEIQARLGWGRTYITQLLNGQKSLRLEQLLRILAALGVAPGEFFRSLYEQAGLPPAAAGVRRAVDEARLQGEDVLLPALVELLLHKRVIRPSELEALIRDLAGQAPELRDRLP